MNTRGVNAKLRLKTKIMNTSIVSMPRPGEMLPNEIEEKYARLKGVVANLTRVLVAFSGGVDSTLVTKVGLDELGADNVLAAIAISASFSEEEQQDALRLLQELGVSHVVIETDEVADPRYAANPINRCYFCKEHVYTALLKTAREQGFETVADGFNADDSMDFRPGRKAGRELGVVSPLYEARMSKDEVRALAKHLGLSNWDKPQMACLSSRVEYGIQITPAILNQVDRAEASLRRLGFNDLRVRHHDRVARVEVEQAMVPQALRQRDAIIDAVKAVGYAYVTIDLEGLRHGSMNEGLKKSG